MASLDEMEEKGVSIMDLYAIMRRSGWGSLEELGAAVARSGAEAGKRTAQLGHIRSYVLEETSHPTT